jgi:hypothetical protein
MKRTLNVLLKILIAGLLLAFFSCSRNEPRIIYSYLGKVYYADSPAPEKRYSFFVLCEEDDGAENLSELRLYNDREGLRWVLTPEDWVQHTEDGQLWIGSRHIVMYADSPLPRGQYRVVLINRGGERTERTFAVDIPDDSPHPFPTFRVSAGEYHLESRYPINRLLCYDESGNLVQIVALSASEGAVGSIGLSSQIIAASLWAEDTEYQISAFTDAVSVR